MKKILLSLGVMALMASSFAAHAQNSTTSSAGSMASTQSSVDASNAGNQVGVQQTYNSDGASHYSGTVRMLSNPGVSLGGAAAGFSNNNCANTAQGGVSVLRASVGIGGPKESKACNYRQNAGTFYAAAGVRAANGQSTRAEALMAMGDVAACRAEAVMDTTDMDNCQSLGIVGNRDSARAFEPTPVNSTPPPAPVKPVNKGDFPVGDTRGYKKEEIVTVIAHP